MDLKDYYKSIIEKYKKGEYTLKGRKDIEKPLLNAKEFSLYAMNYLIWDFMKNKKDDRWKVLLDFVAVPNDMETFDFSKHTFEDFFKFMISIKKS